MSDREMQIVPVLPTTDRGIARVSHMTTPRISYFWGGAFVDLTHFQLYGFGKQTFRFS